MKTIRAGFTLSTEPSEMQVDAIHAYLTQSYWAAGIPRDLVQKSFLGSFCAGVFSQGRQVGFARVVTDRATFAYLCDVYVLENYRGQGLATWLLEAVFSHSDLQGLRRFMLATRDAHALYKRFGFTAPSKPETLMEIRVESPYLKPKPSNQT